MKEREAASNTGNAGVNVSRTTRGMIVNQLREAIVEGRLAPGAALPQNHIKEQFGTSAAPVREALQQLTAEGLVVHYTNRGAFVADFDLDELRHVLLPVRLRVEQYAARMARATGSASLWDALDAEVAALHAAADRSDLRASTAADVTFHRLLIGAAHSAFAEQVWRGAESRVRMQFARLGDPGQRLHSIAEEHRVLLDVLRSGEGAAVDIALHEHIITAAELLLSDSRAASTPEP